MTLHFTSYLFEKFENYIVLLWSPFLIWNQRSLCVPLMKPFPAQDKWILQNLFTYRCISPTTTFPVRVIMNSTTLQLQKQYLQQVSKENLVCRIYFLYMKSWKELSVLFTFSVWTSRLITKFTFVLVLLYRVRSIVHEVLLFNTLQEEQLKKILIGNQ